MGLRSLIKRTAFRNYYWVEKINSKPELKTFLHQFREHYVSCELIRVGGGADGGYLLPNILNDVIYCFSPGVEYTSDFEVELSEKYNIKSFMADASVLQPPVSSSDFEFIPKFLGAKTGDDYITLSDWIDKSGVGLNSNKILQMDIEGGEYDVLVYEDSETLASFSILVIEFHNLKKLFDRDFLKMVSGIFQKLFKNFSICHVHPNNHSRLVSLYGVDVPEVIEVTFVRNDQLHKCRSHQAVCLPHNLDSKNSVDSDDLIMPEIWWKSE